MLDDEGMEEVITLALWQLRDVTDFVQPCPLFHQP
jgi:hypothetical protein